MSQIVIAWAETESQVDPSAPMARRDLGERPKLMEVAISKAAMWANDGTKSDIAKARAYASRQGYRVFVYPASEVNPLGRARRDVLKPTKQRRR